MGLANLCEFVQAFAIHVCAGTRDQSLEVGKWDGLSHRAKSTSKPCALGVRMVNRQSGSLAAPDPPSPSPSTSFFLLFHP